MNDQENSKFLSIQDFLIVIFLTQVVIFLPRSMQVLKFRYKTGRKLVLIRVEVLTSKYNEARKGLKVFEAVCTGVE